MEDKCVIEFEGLEEEDGTPCEVELTKEEMEILIHGAEERGMTLEEYINEVLRSAFDAIKNEEQDC